MKKDWDEMLALFDSIVEASGQFERKGKNMIYTSANGYMFAMLNKDAEIGIRLSPSSGKKFMELHQTGEYRSHGAKMKDYVLIPESLHADIKLLAETMNEGYEYVMSLPPK